MLLRRLLCFCIIIDEVDIDLVLWMELAIQVATHEMPLRLDEVKDRLNVVVANALSLQILSHLIFAVPVVAFQGHGASEELHRSWNPGHSVFAQWIIKVVKGQAYARSLAIEPHSLET